MLSLQSYRPVPLQLSPMMMHRITKNVDMNGRLLFVCRLSWLP
jgi:hypothetical protein